MYQDATDFFENFVSQYDLTIDKDKVESYYFKYHHTYRVVKVMEAIVARLRFSKEKEDIALTIALFHDLGRFWQLEKAKCYDDIKAKYDHAKGSVEVLEEYGWFVEHSQAQDEIRFAILNHNKYQIEDTVNPKNLMYAKLIRDADKLVIMQEFSFPIQQEKVSKKVMEDFLQMKLLDRLDIQSGFDDTLFYLAFLFDFHYEESFQILKECKVLERYFEFLKKYMDTDSYDKIYQTVEKFLEKRKKECLC